MIFRMKLEAVSSMSGVLKIIRSSDVFGYVIDRAETSSNTQRNSCGTGSPPLFEVLAKNLIYPFPNS